MSKVKIFNYKIIIKKPNVKFLPFVKCIYLKNLFNQKECLKKNLILNILLLICCHSSIISCWTSAAGRICQKIQIQSGLHSTFNAPGDSHNSQTSAQNYVRQIIHLNKASVDSFAVRLSSELTTKTLQEKRTQKLTASSCRCLLKPILCIIHYTICY